MSMGVGQAARTSTPSDGDVRPFPRQGDRYTVYPRWAHTPTNRAPHPLALQLRNLQSLVEIGVDKNTTVVFPAPLMSTIGELGSFLAREAAAAARPIDPTHLPKPATVATRNGGSDPAGK